MIDSRDTARRRGSVSERAAVALLCFVSDAWDEEVASKAVFARIQSALAAAALQDLPDLRAALECGLEDESLFRSRLPELYSVHVRGYFERLLAAA